MPRGRPTRQEVFASLDQARSDLGRIGGLPEPAVAGDIWSEIWKEETHHSTAMEGNTLRLKQVQLLLEDGVVSGSSKELREWLEVQAYGQAARWVYGHALVGGYEQPDQLITGTDIRRIHELVVGSVWVHFPPDGLLPSEAPGAYRQRDHDPLRPDLAPMPSGVVEAEVGSWLATANAGQPDECHVIEHLAGLHGAFERIHPFPDGNGRAGRLALNLLLVRYGYPPAVIHKDERQKYLRFLERADNGDPGSLAELLARTVRDGIYRFVMPVLAGDLSMVTLAALATDGLSRPALLAAAQRDRLQAHKHQGVWYSTRQWVNEYKKSRRQGRKAA